MATCSSEALLAESAQFKALDNRQLNIVIAQLLCEWLKLNNPMAQCDVGPILQAACNSKIDCLENRQLFVVIAQLLCEILQSGGGGGQSCIVCGDADPVADPDCPCAFGYNRLTGATFVWDDNLGIWQQLTGGP